MSTKTLIGWWLFIAVIVCAVVSLDGAQAWPESQAIVQFERATDNYAFAHRRIERRLPSVDVTADVATLRRSIDTMAEAIRTARPNAREGDLFAAPVRPVLRALIVRAMRLHDVTVADLNEEVTDGAPPRLAVNGDMPWRQTGSMPPCILEVLPTLPPELQYRFVGADLILVDVHASLVVDILRDAAVVVETLR